MRGNVVSVFVKCFSLVIFAVGTHAARAETLKFDDTWGPPGFHVISQRDTEVEVVYSMGSLSIETVSVGGDQMHVLAIPGVILPSDEGAPNLPGFGRYIAFPQNAKPQLEIVETRTRALPDMNIAPAPPIPHENDDSPAILARDPAIYDVDELYPPRPIDLSPPLKMRGVDVVILGITPFQYNPRSKELVVYTDVRLRVSFHGGTGHFGEDRHRSRHWEPVLRANLVNYASLPEIDFNRNIPAKDDEYEYVIIVPDDPDFVAWADTIKHWRTLQGISTGVFTLTQTGSSSAQIEGWINAAYNTWSTPPVAVLLLSDYPSSGKTYGIISPVWGGYCVSDNMYADVDGDDLPDLNIARITAQDVADLEEMITKFLEYERNPYTDGGFYHHPVVAGGWQTSRWFILCSEIIYGFLHNVLGKEPVREYAIHSGVPEDQWSDNPNTYMLVDYFGPSGLGYIPLTPEHLTDWGGNAIRINNDINAGCFIVQHRDHGDTTGWGEPSYFNDDLDGLSNTMLPFVFSVNCLTGMYNYHRECFTEKFHRMQHGALGLLAASEVSYSFVNDAFVFGIYDCLWPEFMPAYPCSGCDGPAELRPGFAQASGKYFLAASNWPYNPSEKDETYHLFHLHGDAFTTLYSEVPQALTVDHPPVLLIGLTSFPVSVDEGAVIALTVDGEIIGLADGTGGTVDVPIVAQVAPGTMVVTITKNNHFRYVQEVEIIPPEGPYVIYDSHEIEDDSGNDNGAVDAGEIVGMPVTLKNVGVETAYDVSATLSTADTFVAVLEGVQPFGDIDSAGLGTSMGNYVFEVASSCPDGRRIRFDLMVTDTSGTIWESHPDVIVRAPRLSYQLYTVNDEPGGDGDGMVEPGETVELYILLMNAGGGDATGVNGTLSIDDPSIQVGVDSVGFCDLPPGEMGSSLIPYTVSVHDSCPTPHFPTLTLQLRADLGYASLDSFALIVGETGFADVMEGGQGDWTHSALTGGYGDEWHLSTLRNHTPDGAASWKCGSVDVGTYANSLDAGLVTPPIALAPQAELVFWHWIEAETSAAYSGRCYDGGVVEISAGGGSWEQIAPVGGYPYAIRHGTSDPPPFPQLTPCYSGSYDWRQARFDLSDYLGSVQIRFRFGSDAAVAREGWYIDDVVVFGAEVSLPPNPFDLAAPADGDTVENLTPTLSWHRSFDVDGVVEYTLVFGPDSVFADSATAIPGLLDTSYTMTDSLDMGVTYCWKVVAMDEDSLTRECSQAWRFTTYDTVEVGANEPRETDNLPKVFSLSQNYPNPFNPITEIAYALPRGVHVKLDVYNVLGRRVTTLVNEPQEAGYKSVHWDSRSVSGDEVCSGVYFYRISAGDFVETRRMVLLK